VTRLRTGIASVGVFALLALASFQTRGQTPATQPVRNAESKPDLNGLWQALDTAHWDLQAHAARQGPVIALGAAFSVPEGIGVVEGNEIPYRPDALARKNANFENRLTRDPEIKCYLPGIPRATYMPYPFQIVQTETHVLFAYEFANASRTVYMNSKEEPPGADFWMGWSRGRWEGRTLVVDVTNLGDQTWFDRAGNFHSDALHVVERYTPIDATHLLYEATIDDPKVFTRPWKISLPLYRRIGKNAILGEYICPEFAEELMYGHLTKGRK
jgi:hypothetical protein